MILIWAERMKMPPPVEVLLSKPWLLRRMNRTSSWYEFSQIRQRRTGTYRLEILDSSGQLRILFLDVWPIVVHCNIHIGLARPAVTDEHVLFALFALCQLCLVGVVACAFEPYFGWVVICAIVV